MLSGKSSKFILSISLAIFLSGCELFDDMFEYNAYKEKQKSVIDNIEFENNESTKRVLITSNCKYNSASYIYYETVEDAQVNIANDTKNLISKFWSSEALKPHWDIRYVNKVTEQKNSNVDFYRLTGLDFSNSELLVGTVASKEKYDASVDGVKCVDSKLAAGTTINLYDAPEQYLDYSGPQSTFVYRLAESDVSKPWLKDGTGNLLLQSNFVKPIYKNFENNIGGGVNFGLILKNTKNGKHINYIIGVYSMGEGWIYEQKDLKYDPTTKIVHVATTIERNSIFSTMSPKSKEIIKVLSTPNKERTVSDKWNDFYRVNITYDNMITVLQELKNNPPADVADQDFGLSPQDWVVDMAYIQFELEEEGGKALLSGSFRGFEVYTSKLPL